MFAKDRRFYDSHLVSNFSVVLADQDTLAGSDTEEEGNPMPAGYCNPQVLMRRRSSSQQSENPGDTRLGRRGASRHALPTIKCEFHGPGCDAKDGDMKRTFGDHERMSAGERTDI